MLLINLIVIVGVLAWLIYNNQFKQPKNIKTPEQISSTLPRIHAMTKYYDTDKRRVEVAMNKEWEDSECLHSLLALMDKCGRLSVR